MVQNGANHLPGIHQSERDVMIKEGKKYVLSCDLNEDKDVAFRRWSDSIFQMWGAAKEKDRRPRTDFMRGLVRNSWLEDRRFLGGLRGSKFRKSMKVWRFKDWRFKGKEKKLISEFEYKDLRIGGGGEDGCQKPARRQITHDDELHFIIYWLINS